MAQVSIEDLRLLLALRDTGSIAAAAVQLGVSQPSASVRLKELERRLGISLIVRRPSGSTLTDVGRAVAGWGDAVVDALHKLEINVAAIVEDQHSDLRVAASLTVAEYLLPRWIAALKQRHQELRLHLAVMNSRDVVEAVIDQRATIGFIETPRPPRNVEAQVVGWDDLVVVVDRSHRWARRRAPITLEELRTEPLVLRESGSGTRATFEAAVGSDFRTALETDSTSAMLGAAASGVGPAVVSARAASADLRTHLLVSPPLDVRLRRPLRAVWLPGSAPHGTVGELLEIARTDLAREPWPTKR